MKNRSLEVTISQSALNSIMKLTDVVFTTFFLLFTQWMKHPINEWQNTTLLHTTETN